jgi:hypothetical protein
MRYRKLCLLLGLAVVAVAVIGTASAAKSTGSDLTEVKPLAGPEGAVVDREIPGNQSPAHLPTTDAPRPDPLAVAAPGSELGTNFAGLTFHNQRRDADGGNQLSLEPPDQGLCLGNGRLIEVINDLFTTYNPSTGAQTGGYESLNQFFLAEHEVDRTDPLNPVFGTFITDPKCYYDSGSGHFFMVATAFARDPQTGAFEAPAEILVATSKSGTPTTDRSTWNFFSLDVTNDGRSGEQTHPGCPCAADNPRLGIDANGVYVTSNEFPINGPGFNGAQVYAIQKSALIAGTTPHVQRFEGSQGPVPIADSGYGDGVPYSLEPALSPSASDYATADSGTQYLFGALEFGKKPFQLDNRLALWALTNTASLNTTPNLHLKDTIISSEVYGFPPSIVQPNGPTPLADALKEHENLIDGGDDRMQAATLAHGHLWGASDTIVKTPIRGPQVGTAYYELTPSVNSSGVPSAAWVKQGYLSVRGNSVTRPSIAVTDSGKVAIGVSLIGPDFYPSAAYTTFDDSASSTPTTLHVVSQGTVPADGFTGYHAFPPGDGVERWGDYGFAAVDGNSVWVANEWIPGLNQGPDLANWGTYISKVTP